MAVEPCRFLKQLGNEVFSKAIVFVLGSTCRTTEVMVWAWYNVHGEWVYSQLLSEKPLRAAQTMWLVKLHSWVHFITLWDPKRVSRSFFYQNPNTSCNNHISSLNFGVKRALNCDCTLTQLWLQVLFWPSAMIYFIKQESQLSLNKKKAWRLPGTSSLSQSMYVLC